MPVARIVINASPLILLSNSDLAFILPQLFANIVAPEAVWQEIVHSPYHDKAAQMLPEMAWIRKVSVLNAEEVIRWDLGAGETAVLSFAFQNRDYAPVLDDLAAKQCALIRDADHWHRCPADFGERKRFDRFG